MGGCVEKLSEYVAHADTCRRMAKQASTTEAREQLLAMAVTWDMLASRRRAQLQKAGIPEAQDDGSDLGQ